MLPKFIDLNFPCVVAVNCDDDDDDDDDDELFLWYG